MTRCIATVRVAGWLAALTTSAAFGLGCGTTNRVTLREPPHGAVAISPDGQVLATVGVASVQGTGRGPVPIDLWDAATGQKGNTLDGLDEGVATLAFSPDGRMLASGGSDGTVVLWDVPEAKRRAAHAGRGPDWNSRVECLAFSADGKTLAAGAADSTVRLWDVSTGGERGTFRPDVGPVQALAFSPDGKTLAVGGGKATMGYNHPPQYFNCDVKLFDFLAGKETASWPGHPRPVACLAFSPDGLTVASGSGDGTARLWDVPTGKERVKLSGPAGGTWCLAFSPDGHLLTGGGGDRSGEGAGEVKVWDVTTGKEVAGFTGLPDAIRAVVFFPDGKTVISADPGRTVKRWDVPAPKP